MDALPGAGCGCGATVGGALAGAADEAPPPLSMAANMAALRLRSAITWSVLVAVASFPRAAAASLFRNASSDVTASNNDTS
jgi:hypothetical protein